MLTYRSYLYQISFNSLENKTANRKNGSVKPNGKVVNLSQTWTDFLSSRKQTITLICQYSTCRHRSSQIISNRYQGLPDNFSNSKLFMDNTSIFPVLKSHTRCSIDLNADLKRKVNRHFIRKLNLILNTDFER